MTYNAEHVVQAQLDAYNQKDIDAWSNTYAPTAVQLLIDGTVLARGREAIKANIAERFKEPDLYAKLISRQVFDNVVIDHELITRNFDEGKGSVEMLCIYLVEDSVICRAEFKIFNKIIFK